MGCAMGIACPNNLYARTTASNNAPNRRAAAGRRASQVPDRQYPGAGQSSCCVAKPFHWRLTGCAGARSTRWPGRAMLTHGQAAQKSAPSA
jgi:hypothetical protein